MKRLILALAGYALYRWWTSPPERPVQIAGGADRTTNAKRIAKRG